MKRVKVKQIKSTIKTPQNQKDTMIALGLGKINRVVEHEYSSSIAGMIRVVQHLVIVEEI
jgi:large subunit ribosomal protein L30